MYNVLQTPVNQYSIFNLVSHSAEPGLPDWAAYRQLGYFLKSTAAMATVALGRIVTYFLNVGHGTLGDTNFGNF